MLGGQMRLPIGPQGALPFPPGRGFPGAPMDMDNMATWRENFISKYQDSTNRDEDADSIADTDMEKGDQGGDAAINLSSRPSSVPTDPNNEGDHEGGFMNILKNGDAHREKDDSEDEEGKASPPLQLPLLPPGLHQVHQLLQNPFGINQSQIQHFLQQAQLPDSGRKQLEQIVPQLQEQLQMNFVQQTHLLQSDRNKQGPALQQLQIQQQQLISQLQIVQQRLIMGGNGDKEELKENWKEEKENQENIIVENNNNTDKNKNGSFSPDIENIQHTLLINGMCKWTGCDVRCDDPTEFIKHLQGDHILDDKSTAQARVQMQIVSQLEIQLQKERERLQAMMTHLHLNKKQQEERRIQEQKEMSTPEPEPLSKNLTNMPKPLGFGPPMPNMSFPPNLGGMPGFPGARPPGFSFLPPGPNSMMSGPIRRRITDKSPISLPSGFPYMFDRTGLDIAQEIHRNREFYRTHDVRPPFTYASLIRQAIMEVPEKQLTLHGIYDWFTSTFAYFRRNLKSWKNAIRTNLSLHKCFVRYEDDFGSFWMVDDAEFIKRRHLSRGRPRNVQTKSPTLSHGLSSPPFGDNINNINNINNSLKNALGLLNHSTFGDKILQNQNNNNNNSNGLSDVRTSSSFDSLRGRYFPGPPEGADTDLMIKHLAGDNQEHFKHLAGDNQEHFKHLAGDNQEHFNIPSSHQQHQSPEPRYMGRDRMTPPQSPGEGHHQQHQDNNHHQGVKVGVEDLSLVQRNIKNEKSDLEH